MIMLFTDFGSEGPYLGQMEAVLRLQAPGIEIVNLLSNAPLGQPQLASYLLAALAREFPVGSVFVCVVDPGVGGERLPVALEADGRWFVGPDNGLLNVLALQAKKVRWHLIIWRPERLSSTFHGRDLFAPVAAQIALGVRSNLDSHWDGPTHADGSSDLPAIVYIDHYGNACTGLRYAKCMDGLTLRLEGHNISQATTFCAMPSGTAFWYANSVGLVEIAVNLGRADILLNLHLGQPIGFDH